MSTAVTLFNSNAQLPAHLAVFEEQANVLPRETTPAITFRGKVWRLRQGGEEIVLTRTNADGEKEPAPIVKVVVLNMNQARSRVFYAGAYQEGKNQSPACWSSDGVKPDADVKQPCAATCASCPNSVKGSKITDNQKETTACVPMKRIAVVPSAKLDMEALLLKVPQTSLWDKNNEEQNAQGYFAWDQYVDFLRQRGVKHTAAVVTKIKFDPSTAYPKLLFTAERWLEAAEVNQIVERINGEEVKKLLTGKIVEGEEAPVEAGHAAAPVTPTPPVTTPAATAPVPPRPAPAPAPAPATPPVAARPAVSDEDGGDAFASVGAPAAAAPATPVAPAAAPTPPKPPKASKPAAPPAPPQAPVVPAAPVAPAGAGAPQDLAALAAAWDD